MLGSGKGTFFPVILLPSHTFVLFHTTWKHVPFPGTTLGWPSQLNAEEHDFTMLCCTVGF
jgi:hypothetical protein